MHKFKFVLQLVGPTVVGSIFVISLLYIEGLFHDHFNDFDFGIDPTFEIIFYSAFFPVIILGAIVFQFLFTLPLWKQYMKSRTVFGMRGIYFMFLCCVCLGIIFGFLFWEKEFGLVDLLKGISIFFILAIVYWISNLWALSFIERKIS